jgi:hypothetical protein
MMKNNVLYLVLVALVVAGMILMVSCIRADQKEITSLRERVNNLEIVINHEFLEPTKSEKVRVRQPSGQI